MFIVRPVVQVGSNFSGMLFLDKENLGGVGKDKAGIYINLSRKLALHETLELLKVVNGISQDFYKVQVDIQYMS